MKLNRNGKYVDIPIKYKALIIEVSVLEETTLFAAGEEEVIKTTLSGINGKQSLLEVKFGETKKNYHLRIQLSRFL